MCNSLLCGCGIAFLEFERCPPKMKDSERKKKRDKEREWEGGREGGKKEGRKGK